MNYSAKALIKILLNNGYSYTRSKGSHKVYYNPESNKTVIVPMHGKKDMPKGTFFTVLRQAGVDHDEL